MDKLEIPGPEISEKPICPKKIRFFSCFPRKRLSKASQKTKILYLGKKNYSQRQAVTKCFIAKMVILWNKSVQAMKGMMIPKEDMHVPGILALDDSILKMQEQQRHRINITAESESHLVQMI